MFVPALASAWASLAPVPAEADDPAVQAWLAELADLGPAEVFQQVVDSPRERTTDAVLTLLHRAVVAASTADGPGVDLDRAGELLRRMVLNGHGTEFAGGELCEAHAQFLKGVEAHIDPRHVAHRGYLLAALAYRSHGREDLACLADLAGETVSEVTHMRGDFAGVERRAAALAVIEPGVAGLLNESLAAYLAAVSWVAELSAGRESQRPAGDDRELGALLRAQARLLVGSPDVAERLARLADASVADPDDSVSLELARRWVLERRWATAAKLLESLHAACPASAPVAVLLARAWAELGQLSRAKAMLERMLADPPGANDLLVLDSLFIIAYLFRDPDQIRYRNLIAAVDPAADPMAGLPKPPSSATRERVTFDHVRAQRHYENAEDHFAVRALDEAETEYREALRLDPDHTLAAMYLGDVWYVRGKFHVAHAYFEESLAIEPSPQAHRFLGDSLHFGGHGARRAIEQYRAALRLDPGYRGAREAIANLSAPAVAVQPPPELSLSVPPEVLAATGGQTPEPEEVDVGVTGVGDRLRARVVQLFGADSPVAYAEDDERFAQWLSTAAPDEITRMIMAAQSLAFQYKEKDRDVDNWRLWLGRRLALAEALPADFGPAQDGMGHGRDRHLSEAVHGLADLRLSENRVPEARLLYEQALAYLDAADAARAAAGLPSESEHDRLFVPSGSRAPLLRDLAGVYDRLGMRAAAAEHRSRADDLETGRPTTETLVDGYILAGDVAWTRGDTDAALGFYQHAVYLAEDEDPNPLVPRVLTKALNALGGAYWRLGLGRAALVIFHRELRLNERTGNASRLMYDHRNVARVLRLRPELGHSGGLLDARAHLEQALVYAGVTDDEHDPLSWVTSDGVRYRISAPDRAWDTLLELGGLLADEGDDLDAAHFLKLATRVADVLRASLTDEQQRIRMHKERIEAYAKLTNIYFNLAAEKGPDAADYAEEAWLTNESMRARSFLDMLGEAELRRPPEVPAALGDAENELLERRQRLRREPRQDLRFWAEYREVTDGLDAVWQQMLATVPQAEDYVEVRRGTPADPDDLADLLEPCDGRPVVLASFVRLDDRLGVLALRSGDSTPIVAATDVDWRRLEGFVRQNLGSAGRVRELAADMPDLFQFEMRAVARLLTRVSDRNDILIICPVGVLHHVPFGALQFGSSVLLERNPIGLLPSASLLRPIRSAAHRDPTTAAAVLGDPTGDLPGARAEAIAVAERFKSIALTGSEATLSAAEQGLRGAGVLHMAAHARFNASDPLASGVVLADGVLTARDILTMRSPALDLVALSACETGISDVDPGEELVGLSRALIFAGADALIASLWKVPDRATMDIMGSFYDRIHQGESKIVALRAAVLDARSTHGPERMSRWAGFQLIGDWR